ncbi:MAG: hypothetical protein KAI51_03295 [Candidatus Aenigmarchaeota archaeon]|nr:hypothetical protein [Candidatus Aenigmarchaeota archaeon]
MDPLIIGIPGMAFILIAFILDDFHILSVDSIKSIILNITGSAFLAVYAYTISSIPFLILNSVWLVFAVYKMCRILTGHKN